MLSFLISSMRELSGGLAAVMTWSSKNLKLHYAFCQRIRKIWSISRANCLRKLFVYFVVVSLFFSFVPRGIRFKYNLSKGGEAGQNCSIPYPPSLSRGSRRLLPVHR